MRVSAPGSQPCLARRGEGRGPVLGPVQRVVVQEAQGAQAHGRREAQCAGPLARLLQPCRPLGRPAV
eukprot:9302375-Alexandrium_andersonii.AAC.1